jgi:hypothetical protein
MDVYAPALDGPRAGSVAKEQQRREDAVNQYIQDIRDILVSGFEPDSLSQYGNGHGYIPNAELWNELEFRSPGLLPSYIPPTHLPPPPPSYEDALADIPPEYYDTLPALAERQSAKCDSSAPATPANKPRSEKSRSVWKDALVDFDVDFGQPVGVREHKKKKPAAKKVVPLAPPADTGGGSDNAGGDAPSGDGGGDGGGGDAGGDGGGDDGGGGGGDDDWNAWGTAGSKKKTKKQEEEEEEARKAAEASAANNLSWADDADGGGDDWAGFAEVGGKKKKGKVCL